MFLKVRLGLCRKQIWKITRHFRLGAKWEDDSKDVRMMMERNLTQAQTFQESNSFFLIIILVVIIIMLVIASEMILLLSLQQKQPISCCSSGNCSGRNNSRDVDRDSSDSGRSVSNFSAFVSWVQQFYLQGLINNLGLKRK